MSTSKLPTPPFDPRRVGPVDLAVEASRRLHSWANEHSKYLIAAVVAVILGQIVVYAQWGFWFLRFPTLPNWMLVGIGVIVFAAPGASLSGVLLGKGIHTENTIMLSEQNAVSGDQRIRHVAPERFTNAYIINQNGEQRDRDYLQKVMINGVEAYEVDSYDAEGNRIVASSMAGRTNREIRADRRSIPKIKTSMEREVDEAVEFKINFRDIVRERASTVANWIIRTAQDSTIPKGGDMYDEMEESLRDVDPYGDLHSPGDAAPDLESEKDADDQGAAPSASLDEDGQEFMDIFTRAAQQERGGAQADD